MKQLSNGKIRVSLVDDGVEVKNITDGTTIRVSASGDISYPLVINLLSEDGLRRLYLEPTGSTGARIHRWSI